eukprot:1725926-Pyramimonas_sp.AAC.1
MASITSPMPSASPYGHRQARGSRCISRDRARRTLAWMPSRVAPVLSSRLLTTGAGLSFVPMLQKA